MTSKKVEIQFDIDTDKATSNVKALNGEYRRFLSEMGKSTPEINSFMKMATDAEKGQVEVNKLDAETQQLLSTYQSLRQVASARETLSLIPHAKIEAEIKKVRGAYQDLKNSGKLTHTELAQAALKTEQEVARLSQQTNGWAEALGQVKGSLAGLAAGGAGLVAASKQALEFESAMADVRKVTNLTEAEFADLSSRIKDMSTQVPIGADALAGMAAQAGQLGIAGRDIDKFTLLAAKMATAFDMGAEQAGESIAKLKNIFQLPLDDIERLGDAINTLGNNTAAREKDIVEVLSRVGGMAKQFGLASDQVAALSAAFIALGKPPEVAATAINALLGKLQTANVGSKEFKAALGDLGISAEQLAKDIADKPQEALTGFLATLQKLDNQSRAETLKRLFGQEYQDDIALLVGSLGEYEKSLGLIADKQSVAGAMQAEFAARMSTAGAQLERLKNSVEVVAINLGSAFLPAINAVASGLVDATKAVADFVEKFPNISAAAGVVATLAAGLAGLKVGLAALGVLGAKSAAQLVAAYQVLTTQITAATLAANKFNFALAGIGAAVIGWEIGTWARTEFDVVNKAGIAMAGGLHQAFEYARYGWEALQSAFSSDRLREATTRHKARLQEIKDGYSDLFQAADEAQQKTADSTQKTAEQVAETTAKMQDQVAVAGAQMQEQVTESFTALAEAARAEVERIAQALATVEKQTPAAIQTATDAWAVYHAAQGAARAAALADLNAKIREESRLRIAQSQLTQALADAETKAATLAAQAAEEQSAAKAAAVESVREELSKLGVDIGKAMTGVSNGAQTAITALGQVAEKIKTIPGDAKGAMEAFSMAVNHALSKVTNSKELDALKTELKNLLNGKQIDDTQFQAVMELVKAKAEEFAQVDMSAPIREAINAAEDLKRVQQELVDQKPGEQLEKGYRSAATAGEALKSQVEAVRAGLKELSDQTLAAFDGGFLGRNALTELEDARVKMEQMANTAGEIVEYSYRLNAGGIGDWMSKMQLSAALAKEEFYRQKTAMLSLIETIEQGRFSLQKLGDMSKTAAEQFSMLGDQDLARLQSSIDSARQKLEQLNATASSTLANIRNELDQLNGDTEAVQRRNYEQRRKDLEEQLKTARESGAREAQKDYEESIRALDAIHAKKMQQIAEEAAAKRKAREDEAKAKAQAEVKAPPQAQQQTKPAQTIVLQAPGGKTTTIEIDASKANDLLEVLAAAGLRSVR
jgi:TP901 family phage tail tape measure protein